MRDIKRRKSSIQSTQQITKAMKLVSTVKLQKARGKAEGSRPYFDTMYETVCSILGKSGTIRHKYLNPNDSAKKAIIVITANRGLAGGYNANVVKLITGEEFKKEDLVIYNVGKKGAEFLQRRGYSIAKDYSDAIDEPTYKDAVEIAKTVLESYSNGEIGEIYVAYTNFKNTVSHIPTLLKLLPIEVDDEDIKKGASAPMNFEIDAQEALDMLIPKYMCSLLYGALMEAVASENGARMQAMDSATSNADDMISDLSLKYNRARQSSITQELTEIIAGAEAIN